MMPPSAGVGQRRIDLNADLGEGPTVRDSLAVDQPILGVVSSTNVATGAHAGGGEVLSAVVRVAASLPVAVGAHPSYRDRAGFGRVSHRRTLHWPSARSQLLADLVSQIVDVAHELRRSGAELTHVKAHGALYNDAVADPTVAGLVLGATQRASDELGRSLPLVTLPVGDLWSACRASAWPVRAEGFVDRAYTAGGTLVPRGTPGAVLTDHGAMVSNALRLAEGGADTLCVHGDTPGALAVARAVRAALSDAGWVVAAP